LTSFILYIISLRFVCSLFFTCVVIIRFLKSGFFSFLLLLSLLVFCFVFDLESHFNKKERHWKYKGTWCSINLLSENVLCICCCCLKFDYIFINEQHRIGFLLKINYLCLGHAHEARDFMMIIWRDYVWCLLFIISLKKTWSLSFISCLA